jgi:hypothetical protein
VGRGEKVAPTYLSIHLCDPSKVTLKVRNNNLEKKVHM